MNSIKTFEAVNEHSDVHHSYVHISEEQNDIVMVEDLDVSLESDRYTNLPSDLPSADPLEPKVSKRQRK